jgi:selenium metabolism protein YedF
MREESIDCRGLACPSPVLKTKELVDKGDVDRATVLVDNQAARENVSRFLTRSGYQVRMEETDGAFAVTGSRGQEAACEVFVPKGPAEKEEKVLVLVANNRIGQGDDELGRKLMINFLATLKEMGPSLWRLVLLNGGVQLAVEGSEVLPTLQELEKSRIHILVCGTCLDHFRLLEKKQVGETTNMLDVVTSLQLADRVISLT